MVMVKGFYHLAESYYRSALDYALDRDCEDELMIGLYEDEDGGTQGEFAIRWYKLDNKLYPKLEIFSDTWHMLPTFKEVMEFLTIAEECITPQRFIEVLLAHGYKDFTRRISPYLRDELEQARAKVRELESKLAESEQGVANG